MRKVVTANTDAHVVALAPIIAALQARGQAGLRTHRGGQWHVSTIKNLSNA